MDIGNIILAFSGIIIFLGLSIVIFLNFHQKKNIKNQLEKIKMKNDFNEKLIRQSIKSQDEEKSRIGKELHDNINGLMMLAKLNIQKRNITESKDALNTIDEAMALTRDLSHNLAFSSLENFGLKITLDQYIARVRRNVSYEINLNYSISKDLDFETSQQILRIIQEAIMNINKYSEAFKVEVSLFTKDQNNYIVISDNGIGFNFDENNLGIGLHNMKIRSESINAQLKIESELGIGSKISLELPID